MHLESKNGRFVYTKRSFLKHVKFRFWFVSGSLAGPGSQNGRFVYTKRSFLKDVKVTQESPANHPGKLSQKCLGP